jgi:dTDP-4-amino-4,6-dideoxygalactose transaminase
MFTIPSQTIYSPCGGNGYERPTLRVTQRLAQECLTVPCFAERTDNETDRIIHYINA